MSKISFDSQKYFDDKFKHDAFSVVKNDFKIRKKINEILIKKDKSILNFNVEKIPSTNEKNEVKNFLKNFNIYFLESELFDNFIFNNHQIFLKKMSLFNVTKVNQKGYIILDSKKGDFTYIINNFYITDKNLNEFLRLKLTYKNQNLVVKDFFKSLKSESSIISLIKNIVLIDNIVQNQNEFEFFDNIVELMKILFLLSSDDKYLYFLCIINKKNGKKILFCKNFYCFKSLKIILNKDYFIFFLNENLYADKDFIGPNFVFFRDYEKKYFNPIYNYERFLKFKKISFQFNSIDYFNILNNYVNGYLLYQISDNNKTLPFSLKSRNLDLHELINFCIVFPDHKYINHNHRKIKENFITEYRLIKNNVNNKKDCKNNNEEVENKFLEFIVRSTNVKNSRGENSYILSIKEGALVRKNINYYHEYSSNQIRRNSFFDYSQEGPSRMDVVFDFLVSNEDEIEIKNIRTYGSYFSTKEDSSYIEFEKFLEIYEKNHSFKDYNIFVMKYVI